LVFTCQSKPFPRAGSDSTDQDHFFANEVVVDLTYVEYQACGRPEATPNLFSADHFEAAVPAQRILLVKYEHIQIAVRKLQVHPCAAGFVLALLLSNCRPASSQFLVCGLLPDLLVIRVECWGWREHEGRDQRYPPKTTSQHVSLPSSSKL